MPREVPQKDVQQQPVGAAFQISERQVYKQDRTFSIGLFPGCESISGVTQNLTGVVACSYEAGILQIAILVAAEPTLESSVGRGRVTIFRSGGAGLRMERRVLSGRYFHLTNNCIGAGDLAPLNRLIFKLVVESIIHTRQVRQPRTAGCISAIQRERTGIVDQHEFPAFGNKTMQSGDEEITSLLVDGIRQNHSRALGLSP